MPFGSAEDSKTISYSNTGSWTNSRCWMYASLMGKREVTLVAPEIYHLTTHAVEDRPLAVDDADWKHLQTLLRYHLNPQPNLPSYSHLRRLGPKQRKALEQVTTAPGEGLVDLLCYCFLPTHLHLLLRQNIEDGVSRYLQRLLNSYARYFNTRHDRSGTLFDGRFHATHVSTDEQFLHVTRYIHLNPYAAGLTDNPLSYPWSSLAEYLGLTDLGICHRQLLESMISQSEYRSFILRHAPHARELERTKHQLKHSNTGSWIR